VRQAVDAVGAPTDRCFVARRLAGRNWEAAITLVEAAAVSM
jgi:hypothetical protein